MKVPGAVSVWCLLSLIFSIYAQDLDPVVNMCIRFDHQCEIPKVEFQARGVS